MSELLRQLGILRLMSRHPGEWITAEVMAKSANVTTMTIRRDIAQLRHYGAEIYSSRKGFQLTNWGDIQRIANSWYDREIARAEDISFGRLDK